MAPKTDEIDDIFSSKRQSAVITAGPTRKAKGENFPAVPTKPSKQKKVPKPSDTDKAAGEPVTARPEIKIVDASGTGANPLLPLATRQSKRPIGTGSDDSDDGFADSRGKRSKYTDEGYKIYYADDLRIGEGEGGRDPKYTCVTALLLLRASRVTSLTH
ncbi:hypothetical protein EV182_003326 [Spiromyces aspiralis]|uniref:Uncharacterized protein n=1 Tax=Spiromyces aspiralis TaxID=68401 RepID=A0ACC1HGB8_9FUNG|nr:hypothetical protein EV182_003326 [Spiromyces aspiralis]